MSRTATHTGSMKPPRRVEALAEEIYRERYEERVREAGRQRNPGAWVACFYFRRRALEEAREMLPDER